MALSARVRVRRSPGASGIRRLQADLTSRSNAAVQKVAQDVVSAAQRRAPVDTGHLRDSIAETQIAPGHHEIHVGAEYGVYVEYGTRHMAAQPYFRPAIDEERRLFIEAMRKVFRG